MTVCVFSIAVITTSTNKKLKDHKFTFSVYKKRLFFGIFRVQLVVKLKPNKCQSSLQSSFY